MEPDQVKDDFDPLKDLQEGSSGFLQCYLALETLVLKNYDFIDISLILRENFGEEVAEKALLEAKERGIL